MIARVAAFRDYSVFFVDDGTSHSCYVQTWDGHELFCVCVHVESSGQKVPNSELAGLSRVVDSIVSCQLPMSCQGGSASLLRVLSDNRVDGRQFVLNQEFSEEAFLQCFREAHQEVFGMLEVTSMVDFLVLRLRGALQESWMEDVTVVRRCVVAGRVPFADLCGFVTELILVWKFVKEYVRYTGAQHLKSSTDRVSFVFFLYIRSSFCSLLWSLVGLAKLDCFASEL